MNTRLRDALNKRQKSYAVVEKIGDILLEAVPHFGPFVSYGAHQLYGKYEFEKEKNANAASLSLLRRQNDCRSRESWSSMLISLSRLLDWQGILCC